MNLSQNTDSKALKSGIWYTISNFLVKGISFITTPLFTRLMSQAEFGLFGTFASCLSILTIIVSLNLESTLISAKYDFAEKLDEFLFSILVLSSISALIWFLVINLFPVFFVTLLGIEIKYLNLILLYLFFLPAINLFQSRERFFFAYKKTVLISMVVAVGTALVSVILVVFLNDKFKGRVYGLIFPTVLIGAFLYFYLFNNGRNIKCSYWKYALPICLPYIPHLLSLSLLNSTDRLMIKKWCGLEDAAMYSLAHSCGAIVTVLLSALNNAVSPWMGEKLKEKNYNELNVFSKKYFTIFLLMAFGVELFAPEIIFIFGPESYYDAKYIIPPITMGCVFQLIYCFFVNVEQYMKKTTGMAFASCLAAITNIILNYLFIPKYGYKAAAYTTLVGYLVLLLLHMILVYRLGLKSVTNYLFVLLIVLVGTIVSISINLLYSHFVLRLIVILFYFILCIVFIMKYKFLILSLFARKKNG